VLEAVRLAREQTVAVEILVMDDASTDGTGEALAERFPDVRHVRSDRSRGPCYQRNLGVLLASGEIVFPLDDDSWLVSPRTVEQTLGDFADQRTGVVAIPFRNVLVGPDVHQQREPGADRTAVAAFVACAFAIRRRLFLDVGGFAEQYFYMFEEGDLSLRLLDRGFMVELGSADPIDHRQPPRRRAFKPDYFGRRNEILFYYRLAPRLSATFRVPRTVLKGLVFGARHAHLKAAWQATRDGLAMCVGGDADRSPVRPSAYRAFRTATRRGRLPLAEMQAMIDGPAGDR